MSRLLVQPSSLFVVGWKMSDEHVHLPELKISHPAEIAVFLHDSFCATPPDQEQHQ